jgi:hypothetical protein
MFCPMRPTMSPLDTAPGEWRLKSSTSPAGQIGNYRFQHCLGTGTCRRTVDSSGDIRHGRARGNRSSRTVRRCRHGGCVHPDQPRDRQATMACRGSPVLVIQSAKPLLPGSIRITVRACHAHPGNGQRLANRTHRSGGISRPAARPARHTAVYRPRGCAQATHLEDGSPLLEDRVSKKAVSDPPPDPDHDAAEDEGAPPSRAPSGGNMQRGRFLVIRDVKTKEAVGALIQARLERAGYITPPGFAPRAALFVSWAQVVPTLNQNLGPALLPPRDPLSGTLAATSSLSPSIASVLARRWRRGTAIFGSRPTPKFVPHQYCRKGNSPNARRMATTTRKPAASKRTVIPASRC